MFVVDHTTLLRGLRLALHGIVRTHLETTRPHMRLPNLPATPEAPQIPPAGASSSDPYRLEVHDGGQRPRPILVVGLSAPEGPSAPRRARTEAAALPSDLGTPGVMEVCLIQVAPWQATVWRRDASPWDLRRTWTATPSVGLDAGDDERPHPCWRRETVDRDQDLVLTTIDFSIPLTRLIHIAGLTGAWQPA